MTPRRCLGCRTLIASGSRCAECYAQQKHKYVGTQWQTLRRYVLERDGYRCQLRGVRCKGKATQVDHIDSRGPNEPWNLQAACVSCNAGKRDR